MGRDRQHLGSSLARSPIVFVVTLAVVAAALVGCDLSENVSVGSRDAVSEFDASIGPGRADPCGNGVDDDQNGRIDDGCPCGPGETQACFAGSLGNRRIGVCGDGIQVCTLTRGEWGDWGDASCEGSTIPGVETCDGTDTDCDGAVDEGCPCSLGESRSCANEHTSLPCKSGIQTCSSSGEWGTCEGAVAPSTDICDGVDNDCDGRADVGCGCNPVPERCHDGIDNDCDGDTDELACDPDWLTPDADICPEPGGLDDFRSHIEWVTAIPNALSRPVRQYAFLTGVSDDTVMVEIEPRSSLEPYQFGPWTSGDAHYGRIDFRTGEPISHVPSFVVHVRYLHGEGGYFALSGTFALTVDLGFGPWTSDSTLYTHHPGDYPDTIRDAFWALGHEATSTFSTGRHFTVTGVPAHPMPGSFPPTLDGEALVDREGNIYHRGTFEGVLSFEAMNSASTSARPITPGPALYLASFSRDGRPRWLRTWERQHSGLHAVDPLGRFVALHSVAGDTGGAILELLDAQSGATMYRHAAARFGLHRAEVDEDGNVYVTGRTGPEAFTIGPLTISPHRFFVASFDRDGGMRWKRELFDPRLTLGATPSEIVHGEPGILALQLSYASSSDILFHFDTCPTRLPRRWYSREPETGIPTESMPSVPWDDPVLETVLAVFDAASGDLEWGVRADSAAQSAIDVHPSGDLLFSTQDHGGALRIDYGAGLRRSAMHVFRLHR